ncbi:type I glyceraldehyde-3-phosphate dehydrogenase [Proteiniclasticum sp. QWL-01]|uniref:type I glyceraldehyde-3-phosphate dehydrogenase n=1 Tax=Proteiniclasticum sp. QWL-01 TaxID=3036945 RepID=UPI002205B643|nr:type I glyceraldehyde-3-phosphate dehydrogenase [Proteiniclasticum sp. QWL-01]UUM11101.1 type I glyceraldehyde-3-phosphate dehydrogenase [Clostridiaceae bacterium HFYG-1003]WFF72430.1 type I glyceraldehyde-3-phosphate dehydrogenase [Proteiniclasticum sp. QWL-01]
MIRVAVNGYGRIGQNVVRILADRPNNNVELVSINGMPSAELALAKLRFDSIYGRFQGEASVDGEYLVINGQKVLITNYREANELPWKEQNIDIVIESTGKYRTRELAQAHLDAGAKKVIITAPAKDEDITIVMGVNEENYDDSLHHIISNASCTTNCLAPFAKILDRHFGIEHGMMSTVHAYTNGQSLTDHKAKDPRRARAAGLNMIPTTTGAAQAVAKVLPQLRGKFRGVGIRVPIPTVSLVDLVVTTREPVTAEEVNRVLREAAETELKGIMDYNELPLVSSDYVADPHSSIIDGLSTLALEDHMLKVFAWYDNEYGYSCRVVDLVEYVGKRLPHQA